MANRGRRFGVGVRGAHRSAWAFYTSNGLCIGGDARAGNGDRPECPWLTNLPAFGRVGVFATRRRFAESSERFVKPQITERNDGSSSSCCPLTPSWGVEGAWKNERAGGDTDWTGRKRQKAGQVWKTSPLCCVFEVWRDQIRPRYVVAVTDGAPFARKSN
jgi:hypothetical protein